MNFLLHSKAKNINNVWFLEMQLGLLCKFLQENK